MFNENQANNFSKAWDNARESLVNEESTEYVYKDGKYIKDHHFDMNDEEKKKYIEVGNKIDALTEELENYKW